MLNHKGTQPIQTERLLLRRFTIEDARAAFDNWQSDENVTRYLTWNAYTDIEKAQEYLQNQVIDKYSQSNFYNWAILYDGEVVGNIDVTRMDEENFSAVIGYCIGKKWWSQGIVTEALKAVINHLFSCGFIRIDARHDLINPASGKVMEKAGMEFEGIIRKRVKNNEGKLVDVKQYSIINPIYS
ncbi:MAG: GNAT family N-acetyltransferase [Oscillospiraceae bacterium]|nr:GNAT family N-acetyltransferase [Oscillospiraceae bacterium]